MARGPSQRLYGFAANYDVPRAEFEETVLAHGDSLEAARAHHRQDERNPTHFIRCVHCHRMHRVPSKIQLEEHRDPVVRWCWSCSDWRCAKRIECVECVGGSNHRERKMEAIERAARDKPQVNHELFSACVRAGLPWQGMDLEQQGAITVAVPAKPKEARIVVARG